MWRLGQVVSPHRSPNTLAGSPVARENDASRKSLKTKVAPATFARSNVALRALTPDTVAPVRLPGYEQCHGVL